MKIINKCKNKNGCFSGFNVFWWLDYTVDPLQCRGLKVEKFWLQEDKLHRLDGPAIEYADGEELWWRKEWYKEGKLHRLDGPACEDADGGKSWYVEDKLHRLDGPAVEYADGRKEWWVEGKELTEKEFNELIGRR